MHLVYKIILSLVILYIIGVILRNSNMAYITTLSENDDINNGRSIAKTTNLIVGSLLRDAASSAEGSFEKLIKLSVMFKQVDVIILENGSTDGTREKWLSFIPSAPSNLRIKFCDPITPGEYPKTIEHGKQVWRIQKMVNLRNDLLHFIHEHYNNELHTQPEYQTLLLLTDLDIKGNYLTDGVANTVGLLKTTDYNALGFLGKMRRLGGFGYFDPYAYDGDVFYIRPRSGILPVRSSFSGGVFYKFPFANPDSKYSFEIDSRGVSVCEHIPFHRNFKMGINTSMIYTIDEH